MTQLPEAEIHSALATLQSLSDEDLQGLIDDEAKFESYVIALPQVRNVEAEKEMLIASNKSLAEFNLAYEPKLKEGKATLMELYEKARSLTDELETKRGQLESLNSRTSLDTTYALLQTACAEADEESETVSEKLLHGDMDVDSFTQQFVPLRVKAHLRRLKAEKMGELVTSTQRNRSYSAPYPTGPAQMPQPNMPVM